MIFKYSKRFRFAPSFNKGDNVKLGYVKQLYFSHQIEVAIHQIVFFCFSALYHSLNLSCELILYRSAIILAEFYNIEFRQAKSQKYIQRCSFSSTCISSSRGRYFFFVLLLYFLSLFFFFVRDREGGAGG